MTFLISKKEENDWRKLLQRLCNSGELMPRKPADPCKANACLIQKCLRGEWRHMNLCRKKISFNSHFRRFRSPSIFQLNKIKTFFRKRIPRKCMPWSVRSDASMLRQMEKSVIVLWGNWPGSQVFHVDRPNETIELKVIFSLRHHDHFENSKKTSFALSQ